jgi:DNA polymerase-3 subunit delta'
MSDNRNLYGHEWAVQLLKQHISNNAIRHAYLFTGPAGLGRRTLAVRFTQALNCEASVKAGLPCGTCRNCRQIARMQHPDLFILQAETEGGAIKVEQIRELQHDLALAAYQSRYRIAVLLRFEEATDSAANALLKTLEEAPPHVILLLTADDASNLLPTITSRCEVLRLRPLPIKRLEEYLTAEGIDKSTASLCAHVSGGRPGYARRLLEDPSMLELRKKHLTDLQNLMQASRLYKFAYAERLAKDRDLFRLVLLHWLSFWRDVFLAVNGANTQFTNIDMQENIQRFSDQMKATTVKYILKEHKLALERLERYVNPRLLAENLMLTLTQEMEV